MRLKILIASIIISAPLWWGVNVLADKTENLFFNFVSLDKKAFKAQITDGFENVIKSENVKELELTAESAASVFFLKDGREIYLYKKNIAEVLSIASLTKLMAAKVALENFNLSEEVEIKKSIFQENVESNLKEKEKFFLKDLVVASLIESNNSAALALSEIIGKEAFVDLMNLEAKHLKMQDTYFINSTGLDEEDKTNTSSVRDLVILIREILKNPLMLRIISQKEFPLYTADGKFHHNVITTNELLKAGIEFKTMEMAGAKTGETLKAKQCLVLITKDKEGNYLANIVLGSDDRFLDIKKLVSWIAVSFEL